MLTKHPLATVLWLIHYIDSIHTQDIWYIILSPTQPLMWISNYPAASHCIMGPECFGFLFGSHGILCPLQFSCLTVSAANAFFLWLLRLCKIRFPSWLQIVLSQFLLVWSYKSCLGLIVALTFKLCRTLRSKELKARTGNTWWIQYCVWYTWSTSSRLMISRYPRQAMSSVLSCRQNSCSPDVYSS